MNKYLATLGAMTVGAAIMFGFTHSEVRAAGPIERFACSDRGTKIRLVDKDKGTGVPIPFNIYHCRAGKLDCGAMESEAGYVISCTQSGGLFK